MQDLVLLVSKVRKLFVSLDTGQHDEMETFRCKKNIVSEINIEILNDILAEFEGSRRVKNIIGRFNLGELQVDDRSEKFTA